MEGNKDPQGQGQGQGGEANLLRPCPRHMSATDRLCKVIQELVDTEKSYVKVRGPCCVSMCLKGRLAQGDCAPELKPCYRRECQGQSYGLGSSENLCLAVVCVG